jgi:pyruvate/2-oxoglutarate/acetoin dehydrogenase E1 component
MSASAVAMSTKMVEELREGEYEVPFGRVSITRTGDGYKIVIYINERELGRNAAKQIAFSLIGPYLRRGEQAV